MSPNKSSRRRALATVLLASLAAAPIATADSPQSLQDVVVTDAVGGADAAKSFVELVSDETPMPPAPPVPVAEADVADAAPTIDAAAMSAAPIASSCNCCTTSCCTKEKTDAANAAMLGAYKGVFYANDYSYLNDPCYKGPSFIGDCLKGLCCGNLDIGGEARMRYHDENGFRGLGLTGNDDTFFLTRYRTFANWRLSDYFRVYGEYLYADSAGESLPNRPIEENRGEIQNLFLDTKLTQALTLRIGRQELLYGDQRLISPLDWANTRRTFEGVRGLYSGDDWSVDGFFVHPVNRITETESKIDDANEDVDFYGVYASKAGTSVGTMDLYYLGLNNSVEDFDYHTIGSRVVGESNGGTMYALEGGYQFGTNSPGYGDHDAGFMTGGLGRKLSICTHCGEWNPVVWAWYDWASGGDEVPAARGDDSFDHYYPLAHKYLGFMDLFGRRNINDVNFQFITPVLGSKVKMLLWYHYFFLDQKTTPYNVVMGPFNPDFAAGDRELGHEIDLAFTCTINPRANVIVGYSHFNSGDYYKTTQGINFSGDADFFWTQVQWRF